MAGSGGSAHTTIVVVPRENFSLTRASLETLLANTPADTPLVYVDAESPARTRSYLQAMARQHDFTLLRSEHYLTPNEARNHALAHASTEFVAFTDNDVFVEPGWLPALEDCARTTGAWLVGPVYLCGYAARGKARIHQAGGTNRIVIEDGRRIHRETHDNSGKDLSVIASELTRHETEAVEYPCMLARVSALRALGPLDESFFSMHEHLDLCLDVRRRGGSIWFEPASVVTYVVRGRPARWDVRFWVLRWSDDWNRASIRHFWEKWDLTPDDDAQSLQRQYGATKRNIAYRPYRSPTSRITRRFLRRAPRPLPDRVLQRLICRREESRRATGCPPRVIRESSRVP
jgi:GT2 family glycosyltransferase